MINLRAKSASWAYFNFTPLEVSKATAPFDLIVQHSIISIRDFQGTNITNFFKSWAQLLWSKKSGGGDVSSNTEANVNENENYLKPGFDNQGPYLLEMYQNPGRRLI